MVQYRYPDPPVPSGSQTTGRRRWSLCTYHTGVPSRKIARIGQCEQQLDILTNIISNNIEVDRHTLHMFVSRFWLDKIYNWICRYDRLASPAR